MTSEKQIAANRANAEKSTGPKTPETKAISAMNALRHGLTGQVNLMPNEDREAHDKFCAAIVGSLFPEGALEIQFAQSVAEDNWRANRARAIETNMFAIGNIGIGTDLGHPEINAAVNAAEVFSVAAHKFQLLSLYMQRTNRDMQKSLDRLAALQTDRKARRQQALEEAALLYEYSSGKRFAEAAPMVSGQALSPDASDRSTDVVVSGFVFSIHQIRSFVLRKRRAAQAKIILDQNSDRQNHNHHRKNPLRHAA
jgi:hypothetical protein